MLDQNSEGRRLSRRPGKRPGGRARPRDEPTEKRYAAGRGRRALIALTAEEADGDAAARAMAQAIARHARSPDYLGAA